MAWSQATDDVQYETQTEKLTSDQMSSHATKFDSTIFIDGDDDSDEERDHFGEHGPKSMSQKRRAQVDVMKAFAANIAEEETKIEVDQDNKKSIDEYNFSVRDLLTNEAKVAIITNPRDYQTELFQKARTQNLIAVLDTGSGKTHIATLLIRDFLEAELESRLKGGPHRTTFFLVRF